MDEKQQFLTDTQLEAELQSLRSKATISKILTYGSGAAIILFLITGLIPLGIVFIVPTLVGGYQLEKNNSRIKKLLSDNILNSVVKEVFGDAAEYNPWGKINPSSMVFPFSYNCANGSDHIKADYNGLSIELGNIELIDESEFTDEDGRTEKKAITNFQGQWLTCNFGKELPGEVYISEWTKKDRRRMKSNVTTDNELFSKRFCVRADNPQEAYNILTPHMMESILTIADTSGCTVYMSFLRNGNVHVAVNSKRNFFELGKGTNDVEELRRKFLGDLRWFTDIIDTLRVEDTLYKEENI